MRKEDKDLLFKLLLQLKKETDEKVKYMKDHDILSDGGLLVSLTGVSVDEYLKQLEVQKDLNKLLSDLKYEKEVNNINFQNKKRYLS